MPLALVLVEGAKFLAFSGLPAIVDSEGSTPRTPFSSAAAGGGSGTLALDEDGHPPLRISGCPGRARPSRTTEPCGTFTSPGPADFTVNARCL